MLWSAIRPDYPPSARRNVEILNHREGSKRTFWQPMKADNGSDRLNPLANRTAASGLSRPEALFPDGGSGGQRLLSLNFLLAQRGEFFIDLCDLILPLRNLLSQFVHLRSNLLL